MIVHVETLNKDTIAIAVYFDRLGNELDTT